MSNLTDQDQRAEQAVISSSRAASKASTLAKITAPRLRNVYARHRLFRRLDALTDRPLIWLSSPAGSGKTMLIASWAKAQQKNLVWYQCDEGDGDIASFFHFLSLAVSAGAAERSAPLPRLTPDLQAALTVFVRNYFREFFSHLPLHSVVVFDNWQDVPDRAVLRELLPLIVNETPSGITLIVVSREETASNLSRAMSNGQMGLLSWSDMQLTADETTGIAALYESMPGQIAVLPPDEIHAAAQGWVAAVAVLLRYSEPLRLPICDQPNTSSQAVFDYLASEVFDQQAMPVQKFMIKTACLDKIYTAVARELTGDDQAEEILERLVRRNAFTVKRPGSGTFQYHPLLKQFLKNREAASYILPERQMHWRRTAKILSDHEQREEAIHLWLVAEAWTEAADAIVKLAPELTQQGRCKTLEAWILAIPTTERAADAWLTYWLGACQMVIDFPVAVQTLEAAYELFEARGDVLGQMLAAADIIQHYQMDYADLKPGIVWIERLGRLLETQPRFPSIDLELRVLSGFTGNWATESIMAGGSGSRRYWERAQQLIHEPADINCKAHAIIGLLSCTMLTGDTGCIPRLIPVIEVLSTRTDVAPINLASMYWFYAFYWLWTGDMDRCHQMLDRALHIAEFHGLPFLIPRILLARIESSDFSPLRRDEIGKQLRYIDSMPGIALPVERTHLSFVYAIFHYSTGEFDRALLYASELARLVKSGGLYSSVSPPLLLPAAEIHAAAGNLDEAFDQANEVRDVLKRFSSPLLEFYLALVDAEIARQRANVEECIVHLRKAFAVGKVHRYASLMHGYPLLFMRLLPVALEHGIELEYCHYIINKRGLNSVSYDIEHWPWPIKIYTLGRFSVLLDGEPLEFGSKTQHKPLDLLKALLLNRAGISSATLMECLWPDLDGDAARNALNLALHRLRRLLKRNDAILMQGSKLMFDCNQVWVDAWAMQTVLEHADGAKEHEAATLAKKLLHLYRGHFLADEDYEWTFKLRDRLRSQFTRGIGALAKSMEAQCQWEALITLLSKVIEFDPLNEEFHRRLIRNYKTQGRHAESVAAYRRCSELFAKLLGTQPSAATRALIKN